MATVATHKYSPRGTAKELFKRRDDEVLMSGPAGTGKSRACLEKLHFMALLNPGMKGLIVRKTAASLGSSALATWRTYVAKEAIQNGDCSWYGGSDEKPRGYYYTNGSVIVVGGMDKPSKIMSTEYDVIYVQEAIELTIEDWEAIMTRLRNGVISFQQLIADANPSTPTHWLKRRCESGVTAMLNSRHEENPVYFDDSGNLTTKGTEYIKGKLDKLTGVRYQRLRKGQWVAAEGMIYEGFDPVLHVIPAFEIPWEWTRWWVIDFGYTNPFVLQRWAEDPDGRLYLYAEQYETQRLVEDHARDVISLVTDDDGEWLEPRPSAIICDHDAEDRATLEKHVGMKTQPAIKNVSRGIQATQTRMKNAGDSKPRIFFLENALVRRDPKLVDANKPTCTIDELPGYVWDPSISRGVTKEIPLKENDHGCDCVRYKVAHSDLRRRIGSESIWLEG